MIAPERTGGKPSLEARAAAKTGQHGEKTTPEGAAFLTSWLTVSLSES
jgi:hypothetical protein